MTEGDKPEGLVHPRRLIDIPRQFSERIKLDMTNAVIINRELVIVSLRLANKYARKGDNLRNHLQFVSGKGKYAFLSHNDEDVYRKVQSRSLVRKIDMRIRPNWQRKDKPTRIYLGEDMKFECEILDDENGVIEIDLTSTSPIIVEGASPNHDFGDILMQFQEAPSLYGIDELGK